MLGGGIGAGNHVDALTANRSERLHRLLVNSINWAITLLLRNHRNSTIIDQLSTLPGGHEGALTDLGFEIVGKLDEAVQRNAARAL